MDDALVAGFRATPEPGRRAFLETRKAALTRVYLRKISAETMVLVLAGTFSEAEERGRFLALAGEVAGEPLIRFDGEFAPAYVALARRDGFAAKKVLDGIEKVLPAFGLDEDGLVLCRQILGVKRAAAAVFCDDVPALRAALGGVEALLKQKYNPVIDAEAGNLAGVLLRFYGRFDDALAALDASARLADSIENPVLAVQARINMAGVALASGRPADAEGTLREALKTAPRTFAVELYLLRGTTLSLLDRLAESRAALRRAGALARELGDSGGEARALLAQCSLSDDLGDRSTCAALLRRAEPLVSAAGSETLALGLAAASGRLALAENAPARAEALVRRALPKSSAAGRGAFRLDLLLVLADALRRQKKLDEADRALQNAEELVEAQRGSLGDPTERSRFGSAYADVYTLHALVALSRKRVGEAFALSEKLRGLTLGELIRASGPAAQSVLLSGEEAKRDASLQAELSSAYSALSEAVTTDERAAARQRVERISAERGAFQRELTRAKPLLALRGWADFPPLDRASKVLLNGPKKTCVLSFLTTDSATFAFGLRYVRGKPTLMAEVLPKLAGKALDDAVAQFRSACASPGDPSWKSHGARLFEALLAPIREWWTDADRLVLIPDNALAYVPWCALLGEERAVSLAPSLTALYFLRTRPASRRTEFVGYGACRFRDDLAPLKQSGPEVREASQSFAGRATVRLGDDATKERLLSDAGAARILHLATHGRADEARPLESAVFLTPTPATDGVLTARDLLLLPLDADLVTLSACESAVGTRFRGEGVVGPVWALLAAGSRSVVASHWKVDDGATRSLMAAFYRELGRGRRRDEALSLAQKSLRADKRYAHPAYWAAFSLYGDGDGERSILSP